MKIELVSPAEKYRETFLRGFHEFQREGLPWWIGGDLTLVEQDFAAFVAKRRADAPRVTHLWAIAAFASLASEETFVGRVSIRHELNDALRVEGGHIGYDTLPSFRGRGVASEMLRQALPVARSLGLTEVLLTCDDTNAASIRVIERNGGELRETKSISPTKPPKRYYWISL